VRIKQNNNLTDFCGLNYSAIYYVPDYFVNNNAYNPTKEDIDDGNCSL